MAAAKYDFPIEQGSSFNLSIVQIELLIIIL